MGEFGPLVTLRIAIGSGIAFLTAQLLDVAIFSALRDGKWWRAPLASTLIGSTMDTALFFTIAFSAAASRLSNLQMMCLGRAEVLPILGAGPAAPLWVSLGHCGLGRSN